MKIIVKDKTIDLNNLANIKVTPNNNDTYLKIELDLKIADGSPYYNYGKEKVAEMIQKFLKGECVG